MNTCRAIALSFGYVESNKTAWLVFNAENKYPSTPKEALHSLVEYLWQKFSFEKQGAKDYNYRNKLDMARCCQKAWRLRDLTNPITNCPKCNASYLSQEDDAFSLDDWNEFLDNVLVSDCDSYGEHIGLVNPYGWSPWGFGFTVPPAEMLVISNQAEEMLTFALMEIHPELFNNLDDDALDELSSLDDTEDYLVQDYQNLLSQSEDLSDAEYSETTIHRYKNGAVATLENHRYTHIKYNTGDQVFLSYKDGKYIVDKVITYDGKIL